MSAHAPQTRDPFVPFIAEDGLEYEDFAAYILQTPLGCARNEHILAHRRAGRSEEAIRVWIEAYDGEGPTPSSQLPPQAHGRAHHRAQVAFAEDAGARLRRAHFAWNAAAREATDLTPRPYYW